MEAHLFKIDTWEFIKGICDYAIKPLWWIWFLALAIGLLPSFINYIFRKLRKKIRK